MKTLTRRLCLLLTVCLVATLHSNAQDANPLGEAKPKAKKADNDEKKETREEKSKPGTPIARTITVTNPVTDAVYSKVRNTLIKLQHQAEQEDRKAFLILEIERGTSTYGQAVDLAKELSDVQRKYDRVHTVAWIPDSEDGRALDGYIAMVALACREIVMHPDAVFGDIGRGDALDRNEQDMVINMVEKGYNPNLPGALAAGIVNPAETIRKVVINVNGESKTRFVTAGGFDDLSTQKVPIEDVITVKDQGTPFEMTGRNAEGLGVLVRRTVEDRTELPDIYGFDRRWLREVATEGEKPKVRMIKIEGVIDPFVKEFAVREIRRAQQSGANLLIIHIDSPGGEYFSAADIADTLSKLDPKELRTVAWVPDMAISGGAMIALGCDEIYIRPSAKIGDIIPIQMREGGQFERAPEKFLSVVRTALNELAERKGRPPALIESMADKSLVVYRAIHAESGRVTYMSEEELEGTDEWKKDAIVPETRESVALTIDGARAYELSLVEEPIGDFGELKQRLGIPADSTIKAAELTWVDTLVVILKHPAATFLLIMVGLICVYLEVYTLTGFFGIGAALCFAIFFWSRFLGGTAGWLEVVLFLFGLALIAIEIFVMPGFGVFGITGGLALIFSLILASQTFVIPSTGDEMKQFTRTIGALGGSLASVIVMVFVLGRYVPKMPGLRNLVLAPAATDEDSLMLDPALAGEQSPTALIEQDVSLVGLTGVAFSTLRPAGRAQIDGQLIDVVSEGDFIDDGATVEVIAVSGNKVVVRPVT